MFDKDKWQEIFGTIRRHKLRTALTAFSVWWGIFMLVILLGAGTGMQNSILHNFRDDAANALFIRSGSTSQPYKGLPAGRYIRFDNDDYDMAKEVDGIVHHSGRYYLWGEFFTTYKNKSLAFNIRCIHPGHQMIENTEVTHGRYINDDDINQKRKVCVIGRLVKEGFFEEDEQAVGEYLNIKGLDYLVVGVFNDSGGDWENRNIYLPISTAQLTEGTDRIHNIALDLGDVTFEEAKAIEEDLRVQLAARHKFSPADRSALRIWNKAESSREFNLVFSFINGFIWFVGIGSILAGVIGVSNIMLIVVKERTKEIGIRKALGATPFSIVSMIVQEAIFLTGVAGYFGLACGLGVIYAVQQFMESNNIEAEYFRNPEVNTGVAVFALGVLILSGAVAGLIPALQAVRVNPVVAMKS